MAVQYVWGRGRMARPWKQICETGRTHDTNESLVNAAYFGPKNNPGDGPDKYWAA